MIYILYVYTYVPGTRHYFLSVFLSDEPRGIMYMYVHVSAENNEAIYNTHRIVMIMVKIMIIHRGYILYMPYSRKLVHALHARTSRRDVDRRSERRVFLPQPIRNQKKKNARVKMIVITPRGMFRCSVPAYVRAFVSISLLFSSRILFFISFFEYETVIMLCKTNIITTVLSRYNKNNRSSNNSNNNTVITIRNF